MPSDENDSIQEYVPARLYHYTTLESLALILENRTIRLMPIEGMDDLQESRTSDIQNLGKVIFASCWTDDSMESIPMWNMYASLETGVRISLPTMPFKRYRLSAEEYAHVTGMPVDHISFEDDDFETFLPPRDLARGLMSPAFINGAGVLVKIEYTQDKSLLEPKVLSVGEKSTSILMGLLGKYKNEYWSFQREWRYQMQIVPFRAFDLSSDLGARFNAMASMMVQGVLPAPCSYYDLAISDEAMEEFEVVASPKMSAGNKILLRLLLERHGLEGSQRQSELTGLI